MYAGKRLKGNQAPKIFSAVIFPTIIATVVATVITNLSGTVIANRTERENLFVTIQNLYIGSNKDWIDSKLGPATFTRIIDNEFCECVYVCDVAIVRAYFETSSNSCKAFFVTAYNLKSSEKIIFPKNYSRVVSGKALGEFSFYEIDFSPDVVFGFTSSGPGRAIYGEKYFFYSYIDALYDFYFIIMDYGTMDSFKGFSDELDNFGAEYIDDEVSHDNVSHDYFQYITDRNAFYPNTYGISDIRDYEKTIDWICDYWWFDSLQLREDIGNGYSR